jgi:hypothetical protein
LRQEKKAAALTAGAGLPERLLPLSEKRLGTLLPDTETVLPQALLASAGNPLFGITGSIRLGNDVR